MGSLTSPSRPSALRCRGRQLVWTDHPQMVGILNVTPDSFFDGGRFQLAEAAFVQGERLVQEGAAVLDVGGQSTRPGYVEIPAYEEIDRVVPVIGALVARVEAPLSIDTYKPGVARAALRAGAHILNDIYGLQRHPEMAQLAAEYGAAVIAMHNDPKLRDQRGDVIDRLRVYFRRTLEIATAAGVPADQVVLDPGIGFGKTQEQNLEIMARLGELRDLGCPLLLAASRKSVIAHVLDLPPEERLEGTLATTALAGWQGVELVRVHDVRSNLRTARMAAALRRAAR